MADVAWAIMYKPEVENFMKGVGKKRLTLYKNREVALKELNARSNVYRLVKLTLEAGQ